MTDKVLCDTCLHYVYKTCVVQWKRKRRIECPDYYEYKGDSTR